MNQKRKTNLKIFGHHYNRFEEKIVPEFPETKFKN